MSSEHTVPKNHSGWEIRIRKENGYNNRRIEQDLKGN